MKKNTSEIHPHPKLKTFPMLPEDKFAALVLSIRKSGMLKPICSERLTKGYERIRKRMEGGR